MRRRGFTLIELMMTVAIISIVASVAIPKFGNMIVRAKESSTKGALGGIRSAISIYYSDMEGVNPSAGGLMTALTTGGKYLDHPPYARVPVPGNHGDQSSVLDYVGAYTDVGNWVYFGSTGAVAVNCTHPDTSAQIWSTW
ncbi:MAG: type II secretion system protein [Elusimicrobia bacterium]|nr:type II secretion system protein [Elusimicrobiota bacterium]MBP9127411.1 type II secretion system protein [Elusimicrobiota bacterium]MBP9698382.1 type II secretion system protein [Elusimicrobiota bacterium]